MGRSTLMAYDPYCNTSTQTDPNGQNTTSYRDLLCNPTKVKFNDGSFFQFTYDELQRITEVIQPGQRYGDSAYGSEYYGFDPSDNVEYEFDALNRLKKITYPGSKTIQYGFDDGGRLTTLTDINNEATTYTYTDANQLYTATHGGDTTTYTHDDAGKMTKIEYPNGVTGEYTYNSRGDLTRIKWSNTSGTLYDLNYTCDRVGNRIRKTVETPPSAVKSYGYGLDALYRLTSVNQDGSLQSRYTFDPMGNRLTSRNSTDITEYGHDACDEMSYAGDISYKFDLKGRLISEYDSTDNTERTYTWNYDDRLLYINYPNSTKSSMKYDYMGLRTYRKDNAGDITNYYWSLSSLPQVINETDGSGNPKASYILGAGLIAIKVSGVKKYYITDALGSVLALTDSSGNVADTYEYEPFGELAASSGTSYNPYRFTGQQWDEDSEFYYLRARYYDPSTGRFISRDPFRGFLSDSQSQNPYVYCKGNPIFYYDPSGYGNEGLPGNPGGPFEPFRFPPDINKPRDCPPKFPAERFKIPREDVRPLQPKPPGPWKYTRIPEHPVHQTWPPIEPEPGPRLSLPAPPKPLPAPPPVANPIIHVVAQGAIGGLIIFTFTQFFVPHPWAEQQSPTPMPGVRP
jgi:RHS repeat-associated protein